MSEPSAPDPTGFIESAWRDQALWSEVAGGLKDSLSRWRLVAALAGVAGVVLTTTAATLAALGDQAGAAWPEARPIAAAAGALLLALVPYVLKARVSPEQVRAWTRARAASEALKETIYRFLLGAAPFDTQRTAADLVRRCQTIRQGLADLGANAATVGPPASKNRPTSLDADGYVAQRVDDQVERYYYPKARSNALAARRLRGLEFLLSLLAAALGALGGMSDALDLKPLGLLAPWAAVATSVASAIAAHLAAARYDHQATIYFATAERLRGLRDEWLATPERLQPAAVTTFVDACERAIAAENESWLAEWSAPRNEG